MPYLNCWNFHNTYKPSRTVCTNEAIKSPHSFSITKLTSNPPNTTYFYSPVFLIKLQYQNLSCQDINSVLQFIIPINFWRFSKNQATNYITSHFMSITFIMLKSFTSPYVLVITVTTNKVNIRNSKITINFTVDCLI